jgi:Skp family chaperone for outer membrane proteins
MNSTVKWPLVITLVFTTCLVMAAEQKEQKMAFISMERVFDEYYKTKAANVQFKARGEEIDAKCKDFLAKVKSLKAEFDKLNSEYRDKTLNEKARNKKKEDAEAKLYELKDAEEKLVEFDKTYKKEIADQMRQMQLEIVTEIRAVVQSYTSEHNINIVFDSSGKTLNNVESVIYFDKRMDITEPILAIMNKNAPETAKKSDSK